MKISKQVAIKFLDAFDEADREGKLLKVAGGVAQILLLDSFMKSILPFILNCTNLIIYNKT